MAVKRYDGTDWQTVAGKGEQGNSSSITTWVKTASGGETSLTGSSDSSTTLAYTPGQEQFFINGVLQVRGSDYTATDGTSITGITALTAGDIATVTSVNAFSVTGAVPLSTVTANGDLIVGTSSGAVGRLGIGSTGNLLTVSGGVPTWAAAPAAGGMTLLSTTTLSGATTTISGIDQTYTNLQIFISGVTNATATSTFYVWTNSNSSLNTIFGTNAQTSVDMRGDLIYLTGASLNITRTNADNAWVLTINNYASSTERKPISVSGAYDSGAQSVGYGAFGMINATAAVTSFNLQNAGGNFSTGTVKIYGVK
jgi:hypothetical protein